ncbi:hypothetical protein RJT34_15784 [Clitoria ternatea]|uniref:Uncharacterized protein n=1 Tax=Clitoria ternatea TaxID=43366 RepID=A0AAN9PCB6_CLITE
MARCHQGVAHLWCMFFQEQPSRSETLGILAFDAAKTMCRLISLYKSLSDGEILRLHRHIIMSKSITNLKSLDECFLLNLASAERLEDLNLAVTSVSRLAGHCSDKALIRFDTVFADIKHGVADLKKLEFGTREVERKIESMERFVSTTRSLHKAMESLTEMETAEKKLQRWRNMRANHGNKVKVECFSERILLTRRQVNYYKQVSLWNQTFDKVVGLMARIIYVVYPRICSLFGSLVSGVANDKHNNVKSVLRPNFENCCCRLEHRELYMTNLCLLDQNDGLKKRPKDSPHMMKRFNSHHIQTHRVELGNEGGAVANNNRVYRLAPPSTVGGAGLSTRYANMILLMERCAHAMAIGDDVRVVLYEMLPERLREKLSVKLKHEWLEWEKLEKGKDEGLSGVVMRWRETVEKKMEWLSPVAHNMVRWQAERNLEKQKFDTRPTVLLLQTLHYSDLQKVEEATVEVLIGLSCLYWYRKKL